MLVKLKDICNIIMGQSPSSSYYNTSGDGLPFLQGRKTFGRMYPYYETWTTSYNKCANPNDLLLSVRAPVGDMNICQTKTALGRGVAAIHPINISFLYVFYLLTANKNNICSRSTGSVYDSISKPDLENLEFNIHSNEQIQHIVNILGSLDDKIENNEKIITNLEKLQLQTFKDYEASENDSKEFKLSDFIKFIKGKKPNENKNNLMNYLNIEGITTNNFSKKCARYMILADSEDILMVMDGASSGTIFIGNIGIVSSTLAKLEINCEEYRYLIFEKLKVMEKKIKELNTGSAIPHANKDFINSIKLKINCKSEFVNNNLKELNNLIIKIKYENIKFNK